MKAFEVIKFLNVIDRFFDDINIIIHPETTAEGMLYKLHSLDSDSYDSEYIKNRLAYSEIRLNEFLENYR